MERTKKQIIRKSCYPSTEHYNQKSYQKAPVAHVTEAEWVSTTYYVSKKGDI